MKRIALLFFLLFIIIDLSSAQNLLLNPGFEAGYISGANYAPVDGTPDPVTDWTQGCGPDMPFVNADTSVYGLLAFEGDRFGLANRGEIDQDLLGTLSQALGEGEYTFVGQYAGPTFQGEVDGIAYVTLRNSQDPCAGSSKLIGSIDFTPNNTWDDFQLCFFIASAEANYYDRIEISTEINAPGSPGVVTATIALDDLALRKTDLLHEDFEAGASGFTTPLTPACDGACTNKTYCLTTNSQTHCSDVGPFTGTGSFMSVANDSKGAIYSSSQTFEVVENAVYEFTVMVHNYGNNPGPQINVRLASGSGNVILGRVQNTGNNNGWTLYNLVWTATTSGIFNLQLQQHNDENELNYAIDDIVFRERACCAPTVPGNIQCELNQTFQFGLLRWNAVARATYEIRFVPDAACCTADEDSIKGLQTTTQTTSSNFISFLTGGDFADCFTYQIRSVCPDGGASDWSAPVCICAFDDPEKTNAVRDITAADNSLAIFPNPSSGKVHLKMETDVAVQRISLLNMMGMVVGQPQVTATGSRSYRADWQAETGLGNGTYFVIVELEDGQILRKKLVLQR